MFELFIFKSFRLTIRRSHQSFRRNLRFYQQWFEKRECPRSLVWIRFAGLSINNSILLIWSGKKYIYVTYFSYFGMSRSASVVTAFLMKKYALSCAEALERYYFSSLIFSFSVNTWIHNFVRGTDLKKRDLSWDLILDSSISCDCSKLWIMKLTNPIYSIGYFV